jgi:predicted transcriptional regulator
MNEGTRGRQAMVDREHVAKIVSAYAKRKTLTADQLPALIATVHGALAGIEGGGQPEPPPEALVPAVPIRRSIQPDAITCLDCGYRGKMLKRHLTTHQLTPAAYRERWGLKSDYPMIAPNYSARRSELAKSIGLGRQRGSVA